MWHSLLSEISDYFKFIFFKKKKIEFNGSFHWKGIFICMLDIET